jgi:predicted permease
MDTVWQDLRYACRALLNRPGFSALAIFTLAVGIGVNTVAFSAIHALLRKPMSFEGAEALGRIGTTGATSAYNQTSLPDFEDLARENRTLDELFAEARLPLSLRRPDPAGGSLPAEQVWSLLISSNYFTALRVKPLMGRTFTAADARGSDLTAVVSERFWIDRLGGGSSLAGRSLVLNGRSFSIVGVVPEGFQGPGGLFEPEIWLPLERVDVLGLPQRLRDRNETWLSVLGRLAPGVTPAQAQVDLGGIMAELARLHPATNSGRGVLYTPFADGVPELRMIARFSWMALAVVGTVLLIACFNVAGLLLARASERQREMGVRAALGASRGRMLRQLVTEGLMLAVLSGAASLLLASWSADLLSVFSLPSPIPQRVHISLDWQIAAFTLSLVALAGILPALVPALQASRADLTRALRRDAGARRRPSRLRNAFVIAQVAGSTLFLAAALLFVRSFWNATRFSPGFDTAQTLTMELTPSAFGYEIARASAFFQQLTERIANVPGVRDVALADRVPFSVGFPKLLEISGDGEDCATATCRTATEYGVSPGHFRALGIRLVSGRDLTAQEYRDNAPVAIVNQTMAAALARDGDAVGRWIRTGKDGRPLQVVGVAERVTQQFIGEDARWYLYRPLRETELGDRVTVIVRAADDPRLLIGALRQQVQALDPALPVSDVKTMQQRLELPLWPSRTAAGFFLVCGSLALVLATVGLFGVTSYTVSQRTREFGVRVALGATRIRVVSLVVREGLSLGLPGVALGIIGALVAMRLASRALFGITPADPGTYVATAAIQLIITLAACAIPANRATRADPMLALRQE